MSYDPTIHARRAMLAGYAEQAATDPAKLARAIRVVRAALRLGVLTPRMLTVPPDPAALDQAADIAAEAMDRMEFAREIEAAQAARSRRTG